MFFSVGKTTKKRVPYVRPKFQRRKIPNSIDRIDAVGYPFTDIPSSFARLETNKKRTVVE
jgi:hypothetical protein